MSAADRASAVLAGGVSSPARAFGAVGGDPVLASFGEGPWLTSADGERYADYIQGFGSVILGHAHPAVVSAVAGAAARGAAFGLTTPAEVQLAELVCERMPSVERVRFLTSGTEASMTAARIARAATGRSVIVKFEGCYHGHADAFLAKAGSGVATFSVPSAAGVSAVAAGETVTLPYNDLDAVRTALREHEVAAVFVEPVAANMGVVAPADGFLDGLRDAASRAGAVLVFDEVVTGFRLGRGGAQERFGVAADLTMLGKVIGGGLPIGAVGGRGDLMALLAPQGPVYQAGTFAAHPHAMAAGAAALSLLDAAAYARIEAGAKALADGLSGLRGTSVARVGTLVSLHFTSGMPRNFAEVSAGDLGAFAAFHRAMRAAGVLVAPSAFEAWFVSLAHDPSVIEQTVRAARRVLG